MSSRDTLGALLQDILQGGNYVRLDTDHGFDRLVLDLTWPLTREQTKRVREILRAAATESERDAETD